MTTPRIVDGGVRDDGGVHDDGGVDSGTSEADAGLVDAGSPDTGPPDAGDDGGGPTDGGLSDGGPSDGGSRGPIVILMIGDGMGMSHLDAASYWQTGTPNATRIESLENFAWVRSTSWSGTTDSAAAATTMATGVLTLNRHVGVDVDGNAVATVVEDALALGLRTGVVTTDTVSGATPAGFTAHQLTRYASAGIASDQALLRPTVFLGGGQAAFDPVHLPAFTMDGFDFVTTGAELAAAPSPPVLGLFASGRMSYLASRAETSTEPTLTQMTSEALRLLDDGTGFFLVVEGAFIDKQSHANNFEGMLEEMADFDDAVGLVIDHFQGRDDVTLLVTADHETGGLTVEGGAAGELPTPTWRWTHHSNQRVGVWGRGPGTDVLNGTPVVDHRWVHAILKAQLFGIEFEEPEAEKVANGELDDLSSLGAEQTSESSFGVGYNQLDRLFLDADDTGLFVGVEGVFESDTNHVVVMIDADFGEATGLTQLGGQLTDVDGVANTVLAALPYTSPQVAGFGIDFAVVTRGDDEQLLSENPTSRGLRGFTSPVGELDNLASLPTITSFRDDVISRGAPSNALADQGLEVFIRWEELYPSLTEGVPPGTQLGVSVVLVGGDGEFASNQALPGFSPPRPNSPGATAVALPGVVEFPIDPDGDGIVNALDAPIERRN